MKEKDAFESHIMLLVLKTTFWQTTAVKIQLCYSSSSSSSVSPVDQAVLASWAFAFIWDTPSLSSASSSAVCDGGQGQDAAVVGEILRIAP